MATVSGENKPNTITVSGDTARYYGDLAKGYRDECEQFVQQAEECANTVLDKVDEINTATGEAVQTISNLQTIAVNAVQEQENIAISHIEREIAIAQDWANKMDGKVAVDDEEIEYSAKYYATQTQSTATQAISDITTTVSTSLTAALSDISTAKTGAVSDVNTTKSTAISNINTLAGEKEAALSTQFNTYSSTLDNEMDAFIKNYDRLYEEVNLEVKFADEIAQYANKYAWLEARKNAGNYEGIHVGDYFYTSISAGTVAGYSIAAQNFKCRIVGLDTYKSCADNGIGHMIYIISDQCIDTPIKWNPEDNNNGTSVQEHPWLASAMYGVLNGVNNYTTSAYQNKAHGAQNTNGGIIGLLPAELRNVLKQKRNILDKRYSASGLLTGGTGWDWLDMGKLWLPNEIEVYGCGIRSNLCLTSGFWFPEAGLSIQFPWFANNCEHRIKRKSDNSRCTWWLSSVASSNSSHVCLVNNTGYANSYAATNATICAPLCFCI